MPKLLNFRKFNSWIFKIDQFYFLLLNQIFWGILIKAKEFSLINLIACFLEILWTVDLEYLNFYY